MLTGSEIEALMKDYHFVPLTGCKEVDESIAAAGTEASHHQFKLQKPLDSHERNDVLECYMAPGE